MNNEKTQLMDLTRTIENKLHDRDEAAIFLRPSDMEDTAKLCVHPCWHYNRVDQLKLTPYSLMEDNMPFGGDYRVMVKDGKKLLLARYGWTSHEEFDGILEKIGWKNAEMVSIGTLAIGVCDEESVQIAGIRMDSYSVNRLYNPKYATTDELEKMISPISFVDVLGGSSDWSRTEGYDPHVVRDIVDSCVKDTLVGQVMVFEGGHSDSVRLSNVLKGEYVPCALSRYFNDKAHAEYRREKLLANNLLDGTA